MSNSPVRRKMPPKNHHLVRRAARLATIAIALGALSGCQAIVSSAPLSQVRVIDVSPDAPGLDVYQGGSALAYNLGFGTVTSYIPLPPAAYTLSASSTGTRQALASSRATFAPTSQYTILIGDVSASLQQLVLTDQSQPAPSGQIALRFIDQATRIGPVDVYLVPANQKLTAVAPVLNGLIFGVNTGYLNIPTGTYTLVMLPAGAAPASAAPAYTGTQVTYAAGAARTIILIDQQPVTPPGLQVITANDYDSPSAS
jgi:hypothetical protein